MKAVVLQGPAQLTVEDLPERPLQSGEVRVRIEAALTCGTDLKVYKRGYHARMIQPPAVFGHEMAGVITEVDREVLGWRVGDRVVVANSAPCGQCPPCLRQQENLCDNLLFLNGAYAESVVVPRRVVERNLWKLSEATSFRDAALTEPLACVVLGVDEVKLQPGMRALVIGAGPIGLMFVALAAAMPCEVTVAGRGKNRLQTAHQLGAHRVLDVHDGDDLADSIRSRCPKDFDVVIEAVGKPETWSAALQLVRKGGRVNLFGGCPSGTTIPLDTTRMHYLSLTLVSSFHHTPRTFHRALEFIERGVVRSSEFVDGECALSRLPELFRSMAAGNKAVKHLVSLGA
jgi:L-iditol 2-dehydrogenase